MAPFPQHSGRGLLNSSEAGRVLGFFKPGGAPTVLEPGKNSFLTAMHEQVHFDDITNTLWGFILRCEKERAELAQKRTLSRWLRNHRIRRMLASGWNVLEGSAVCSEVLYLIALGRHGMVQGIMDELPRDYARAARPMIDTILEGMVKPASLDLRDQNQFIFVAAYKSAFAELALDLQMLHATVVDGGYAVVRDAALASRPNRNFKKICRALPDVDFRSIHGRILEAESRRDEIVLPGEETVRAIRLHICTIKQAVAEVVLGRSDVTVSDKTRVATATRIRAEIETKWPACPRLRYRHYAPITRVTDVTGGRQLPAGSMQEIELEPEEFLALFDEDKAFLSLMPEAKRSDFTCRLIWTLPVPRTGPDMHFASELNFARANEESAVASFGNLIRYAYLNGKQLQTLAVDRYRPSPTLAWLGYGVPDHDGNLADWNFWSSRADPVYLWCPVVSGESIIGLRRRFGTAAKLAAGPVPGPLPLTLLRCEIGHITLFWLDAGITPLDIIKQNNGLRLNEETMLPVEDPPDDDRFRAAYITALHVMPRLLKSLGLDVSPD